METTMEKRALGNSSLSTLPLVLGGNVFGWTADEATSFRVLDAFVAAGFTMIDTADVYSRWVPGHAGGESETVIGKWMKLRGNRDKVQIATKVGMEMAPDRKGLSRDWILRAVEDSLARLQTDHIDLYQSHTDDDKTTVEETLSAYDLLVRQGKVRWIGASNFGAPRLKESLEVSRRKGYPFYRTLQPLYNLSDRDPYEAELEGLCASEGLGVITYFSLASGFLTGKYRSEKEIVGKARAGEVMKHFTPRGQRILKALDAAAARHGVKQGQIALAWLIARPSVTAPIASATSLAQLAELIRSTEISLDRDTIETLNQASAPS
jgi:aryl-alcohol dehydrogenase-like predicted oxidoreductase